MSEVEKTFRAAVADALRPVHVALGEALARLAEHGVTGHTYHLRARHVFEEFLYSVKIQSAFSE